MRLLVLVSDAPGRAWLFCFSHLFCSSGHGSRTINAPFGDSHDGRNAGVWAAGSRSLSEEGPVASRLGTHSPVSGVYANHPPLIYVETAAAELLGFGTAAATRAPAWAGSLIVLILLGRLLRESGVPWRSSPLVVSSWQSRARDRVV